MSSPQGRLLLLASTVLLFLSSACIFGGGDDPASITRPESIPTATPPATPPEPIVLGGGTQTAAGTPVATQAAGAGSTYELKPGDTLLAMAVQMGVPSDQQSAWTAEVLRLNSIPDATLLQAGQELLLPPVPRPAATATGTPAATVPAAAGSPTVTATRPPGTATAATATPAAGGRTYTVVSGDYPLLIATKSGVPDAQAVAWANELIALNNITSSGLQIGQVLQLPPTP